MRNNLNDSSNANRDVNEKVNDDRDGGMVRNYSFEGETGNLKSLKQTERVYETEDEKITVRMTGPEALIQQYDRE